MRQISRIKFGYLVIGLSLGMAATAPAQSGKPSQRPTQPQQQLPMKAAPQKAPAKEPPAREDAARRDIAKNQQIAAPPELTPELEEILAKWEKESAKIKTLHGKQSKSEFNHTFAVEKVTSGDFFFETPDKGRIDMLALKIGKNDVSNKKTKDGDPYKLEAGISERWISTGDTILQIEDDAKTYMRVEIPEEQRGANIVHSPLPFLFGMKALEAKTRFNLNLLKNTEETATILVIPRMEKDRQNYKKAAITLNKKTYLPTRVHMLGDEGMENVYTFESVQVNKGRSTLINIFGGKDKDPYHPDLRKHTLVIPPDPTEIQPVRSSSTRDPKKEKVENAVPNPSKRPPTTANGPDIRSKK